MHATTATNTLANTTEINIKNRPNDLHNQTLALVKEERRLTGLVIANLQKIQDENLHLKMGYASLFEYCNRALGYPESCSYRRISAVKVMRQIPDITATLNDGTLSLTSVAMAQSLFANAYRQNAPVAIDTKKEILKSLENCNKRQSEDLLIEAATKLGLQTTGLEITEKVRPLSTQESILQVRLKTTTLEKLNRLKNLRAHKNPNMGYADLIEDLCSYALKKLDPLEQTTTEQMRAERNESQNVSHQDLPKISQHKDAAAHTHISPNPRYIPPHIRREVWRRDQGRCTYVADAGKDTTATQPQRCRSNHLLQIDHIKPVSLGGETVQQNLRLLCHAHHKMREAEF